MLSFANDYNVGAHPRILERLMETNLEQLPGYGADIYTEQAKEKLRAACGCPEAEVYLLAGGTQTNQVVISSLLRSYEGVISAATGHINAHEAGAIEYSGHKVLALPAHDGKLCAEEARAYLAAFYADESHTHMVFPGMVYLSYPTEYGTLYTKEELSALHALCREYEIPLFIDGARLGYGLASRACDLTLPELASLCDVFYIGGTKVGALIGEAVVFSGIPAPRNLDTLVKQRGAMLAKGRVCGIQFDTLFTDGLYLEISRHAIDMAEEMKEIFRRKGIPFYLDSPTNQQFVILENERLDALRTQLDFSVWEPCDGAHTVVRFATSWATTKEQLSALEALL